MIAGRCLAPLGQVAGLLMQYQNARTSLASIDNYEAADRTPRRGRVPAPPGLPWRAGIPRRHLRLPGSSQPALKRCRSRSPGEKVGIIGRIGSGKTTLEKLALALYKPTEGAVLLDGVDVRQIDPADVRRAIGHVPQDPLCSMAASSTTWPWARPMRTTPASWPRPTLAGVSEFANLHPNGFDMLIGERGESVRRPAPVGGGGPRPDQRPAHPAAR